MVGREHAEATRVKRDETMRVRGSMRSQNEENWRTTAVTESPNHQWKGKMDSDGGGGEEGELLEQRERGSQGR